nr:HAMP domain-containing sensor histidine kinase [uncultured Limnohabitans sp.]
MHLDTQTTIFMICFVYLMLHGAIWLALLEYRSFQVKLWCASGLISGVAVILLALRGTVPEVIFFYVAQFLMLIGNWGRMVALRLYLRPAPQSKPFLAYTLANATYFAVFSYLIYFHQAEWEALLLFNGFYAVLCFDYFRIGQKLNERQASLGSKLLMWAGLSFTVTLATRTFGVALIGDMHDIYAPSWDQGVMVAGQFTAITLSNIAFLRIFLEIAERQKIAMAHELAVTNERAESIRRTSLELQNLLQEREEIIRQLAIFNKTAGMGALVASLAHELNQPLTAMQINAELIDSAFLSTQTSANSDHAIKEAMSDLLKDNQRAATIIKTLRNMFGNGRKSVTTFDMNELVNDVLLICKSRLLNQNIALKVESHPDAINITGDKSQLQQVFLNLINNAADAFANNFSAQKLITVRTELQDNQARLTVADNGSGISSEIIESIFVLLRTNKDEGMGIGLWLSKTIVESHQGTIDFETSASTGTTFTVTLPFSQETLIY